MEVGVLDRIEEAYCIRLPRVYRRSVAPFPIPRGAGNTDFQVWDDVDRLIALNQRLRTEVERWPLWLFVIGQTGAATIKNQRPYTGLRIRAFCPGISAFLAVYRVVVKNIPFCSFNRY